MDIRDLISPPGNYTEADRYRDFRAVFFGESTPLQGRRVLWQILEWCRLFRPVSAPGDPHETYRRDGERNIGLKIFMTLNAEPALAPPTETAVNEAPEERT